MIRKRKSKSFVAAISQIMIFVALAMAFVQENDTLLKCLVIICAGYVLEFELTDSVFLIAGLSIYDYAFNWNGAAASFIITLLFVLKMIWSVRLKLSVRCFISLFLLILIELMGDRGYSGSSGEIILALLSGIFIVMATNNINLFNLKLDRALLLFSTSYVTALYCIISRYGTFSSYVNLLFNSSGLYRFGIGNGNVMGGAMSIPLYALMLLSLTICYFFSNIPKPTYQKVLIIAFNAISCLFAALTISRSFFFGLFFIFVGIIYSTNNKNVKKSMRFLLLAFFTIAVLVFFAGDIVDQSLSRLMNRVENANDASGGERFGIWGNALTYLLSNPLNLLFGFGACSYSVMDGVTAGMHNLLLDILMSWGIVGLAIILYSVIKVLKCKKEKYSMIPFYAFSAFSLTALRSYSIKTWSFLLITLLVVTACNKNRNEGIVR